MRWVFHSSFVGADRRRRNRVRFVERRRDTSVGSPPALGTALRQLKLAAFDVCDMASLQKFVSHASSVSLLALSSERGDIAALLAAMVEKVERSNNWNREMYQQDILAVLLKAQVLVDEG